MPSVDDVVIENDLGVVEGWRVDQVLVDLFGLKSARSKRFEDLMNEREKLLAKKQVTVQEKARLTARGRSLFAEPAYSGSLAMSD